MAIPRSFRRKLIISLGLGGICFFVLALLPDREALKTALGQFTWQWFPLALGLAGLNYLVRAVRWGWYLHHLGIKLPLNSQFPIFLIGLMLSVTPGKAGELFKAYLVKLANQTPMSRTAPIVVMERLTDLAGMLLLATLGLLALRIKGSLVLLLWLLMITGFLLLAWRGLITSLLHLLSGWIPQRIMPRLQHAYDSLVDLMDYRCLTGGILLSMAAWFAECISLQVILWGFGYPIPMITATFIYSFSTLAGAVLFFMPGGIGGTEAAMVSLLREVGGVPVSVASLGTVLTRAATLWFAVVIGLIALFFSKLEIAEDVDKALIDNTPSETTP